MIDDENPFRKRRFYNDWWIFEWLPYVAISCLTVGIVFMLSWCRGMREQSCRDHGGDHLRSVGRHGLPLCVTKDGRIVDDD